MKPETLEALLLDRALGELSPEIAELLDAHFDHDPEAAQQADRLAATVHQARQAVAVKQETPRRPLAVARLRREHRAQRQRAFAWELARLAACVVLGLAVGWYGRTARETPAIAVAARPVPPVVVAAGLPPSAASAKGFWSLANLAAAQRERQPVESRATSRYRLRWDSPVKMPRVEENL
jgi:anti-sigma factor RsiW